MARHTISIPSLTAAFALMATFGVSINADAQTGNERAHAQESALDEVVVTSRRREENLQSVPISIQAINSEDLQLRGMERIQDVIAQTPNVFTASNPLSTSNFSMRGIPNVGVFVDGIWQRSGVLLNQRSTLELASVEILRGPQGTLYGRDSTGGAIRLITQLPSDRFGARLVGTTGSYRRLDLTANVDIPISDTLLTKWSASRETRDGYIQSLSVNRAYGEIDNKDLRGDILWKPSDSFKVRLTAQKSLVQSSDTMVSTLLIDPGTPGVGNNLGYIVHPRQYYQLSGLPFNNLTHASGYPGGQVGKWQTKSDWNSGPGTIIDTKNLTLKMDYRLTSSITLTSLTGYVRQTDFAYEDYDASAYQFQQAANMNQLRTTTQEFQLTGAQGRFNWVAGLYGWNLYNNNRSFRWALLDINVPALQATPQCRAPRAPGVLACATLPNNDTFTGNSENGYAAFGEVTAKLVRGLLAESGVIYTNDDGRWVGDTDIRTVGLPVSVKEVVGRRVAALGADTERLLTHASVIGRDFDLTLLAAIAAVDEDAVIDCCDAAVAASVLRTTGDTDRYTFAHALIEHTLCDGLSPARRARIHRAVAEAIESATGDRAGERAGELAHHWSAAVRPADADRALHYTQLAAERALDQFAPHDAMRWYLQALEHLDHAPVPDLGRRARLLVGLGTAQRFCGVAEHRTTLLAAADLADQIDDIDVLVDASLANTRSWQSDIGNLDVDRLRVLQRALDRLGPDGDPRHRAQLLVTIAVEHPLTAGNRSDRRGPTRR